MQRLIPQKLKSGDGVRIIAPARSLAMPWISQELKDIAIHRLQELWLKVSFANHVDEIDAFDSSSIESRVHDIHAAFADPSVHAILTVIWGFNSNQLLRCLDYDLIKNNPKILCGYSDITALSNAIYAKTGLVTYSGPHYFSFGDKLWFEYTNTYFKKCLFSTEPFDIIPSQKRSDDRWARNQDDRNFIENNGYWVIQPGAARGNIVGGNQCTLNLLQGSEFMPNIQDSILFIEDDSEAHIATIDRDLQSLIHQPWFKQIKGIVFGRFQTATHMTQELLTQIVTTKKELHSIPVLANVDFWHTTPMITFPIWGTCELTVNHELIALKIVEH